MDLEGIKIKPILESLVLKKIPDSVYFSDTYADYISNSRLGLINPANDGSPEKFFEGLGKNNVYSDALIFGSCIHEMVLQNESFEIVDCVNRTTAKKGFMHDLLYEDWLNDNLTEEAIIDCSNRVNYYKDKMDQKKINDIIESGQEYWSQRKEWESVEHEKTPIYLDPKMRERAYLCIDALNQNKQIQNLLHPEGIITEDPISENEQAILLDLEITMPSGNSFIFKIKSKLDNYTIDPYLNELCCNDVKTIGKVLSEFDPPNGNFSRFSYHRELALYSWLLTLVAEKYYNIKDPTVKSNCLVVSTIPAYYTKVYEVTKADFSKGWNEFVYLIKLAAYYYDRGYRF